MLHKKHCPSACHIHPEFKKSKFPKVVLFNALHLLHLELMKGLSVLKKAQIDAKGELRVLIEVLNPGPNAATSLHL